jgi:hypothetical protein
MEVTEYKNLCRQGGADADLEGERFPRRGSHHSRPQSPPTDSTIVLAFIPTGGGLSHPDEISGTVGDASVG